jgi:thioredoxin-like negative regulator of GroEL
MLSPIVDELAAEVDGLTVMKVDTDEHPAFSRQYGVMSVPTLLFFRDGRLVHRVVGARRKRSLLEEIAGLQPAVA